jgi:hypothetical protein
MKFKINTAKTKLMTPGNRQTVTVMSMKTASRVSQT